MIVYDGQCPVCTSYVKYYRMKDAIGGNLDLVDARALPADLMPITAGYDLNEGMLFIVNGNIYYGPDAVQAMAGMGSRHGWFNRLNAMVFAARTRSRVLYPLLRAGRKLLLLLLGRSRI